MKKILILLIFFSFFGCNKPKTVLICGDHVCVNKDEAKQYFEENLSLEVKILNNKNLKEVDLVELNLANNPDGDRKVNIFNKKKTNKKIKRLSKDEIKIKKAELKKKKEKKSKIFKQKNKKNAPLENKKVVKKSAIEMPDICTLIKECSIDEISKFLIKNSKNKDFPDITSKE